MIYPQNCKAVIDVTKPPYNLDNTGQRDCTQMLISIVDDILRPNIEGIKTVCEKLRGMNDPNARLSFENHMQNGVMCAIFPENPFPTKIIYFPAGTYLVSDTISYSFDNLQNILNDVPMYELNWLIHFKGEAQDKVKIKLADNSKGFEFGNERPIISFIRAEGSNLAMTNTFEDITIDCGKGNPGAIGLEFFANNSGKVKNVSIISSDPEKKGFAGLSMSREIISGGYIKNLYVDGFDYGIRVLPLRNYATLENITVTNQRKAGIFLRDTMLSVLNFKSTNNVSAIKETGSCGQLALINAECKTFGFSNEIGIWGDLGNILMRNVDIIGYKYPFVQGRDRAGCDVRRTHFDEFSTDNAYTLFENSGITLNLPIESTPEPIWEAPEKWCCVNDFGAVCDGVTDCTRAIEKVFNSGAETIYFQPGRYFVNDSISIPASVKNINFMFCDFVPGDKLRNMHDGGLFVINEYSSAPLFLEDVFTWEQFYGYMRFLQHSCKRTLVMSDLHTQTAAMYFNTVPGAKVYIENCACTIGDGGAVGPHKHVNGYTFRGQQVWARNINPERSLCQIENDGSMLWLMGFKTEGHGTAFKTVNGGSTEVLGGTISMGNNSLLPAIINNNSDVSVYCITNGYRIDAVFPICVEETQKNITRRLFCGDMPVRMLKLYRIPGYIGRRQK